MSLIDPAFKVIPKNSTYFLIWRIEKLQLVQVPKDSYGSFFTGDSYIIICANDGKDYVHSESKWRETKNEILEIYIHFWLGSDTSLDEAGVAAYKTVELDDLLGGSPVQMREVQGHESKRFLSYFRNGIRLLQGGVASGFNHVEKTNEPRLFHIKGKRIPIVKQCAEISWESMNSGDVFILDTIQYIYLWNGSTSNYMEKIQGAKIAQQLKGEHGPQCDSVIILEDGTEEHNLKAMEKDFFEKYLPLGNKSFLKAPTCDATIEKEERSSIKLFRCSDDSGTIKVEEIKQGPLSKNDLDSNDTFIIDNNINDLWVWVGKNATKKERVEAMRNAQGFIKKKGYPDYISVTRVIDGAEPIEFKSLFKEWKDTVAVTTKGKTYFTGGKVVKIKDIEKLLPHQGLEISHLKQNPKLTADIQMLDDLKGKKNIFLVKDDELISLNERDWGNFFSANCLIILYTYYLNSKKNNVIYYWLGSNSSAKDREIALSKAKELDKSDCDEKAVIVRVIEGKEPPHFAAIFEGLMIIYNGTFQPGFRNAKSENKYLLHVRGTNKYVTRAVEVECNASSLNSNDVFILFTPSIIFIWAGKGSTGDEREMAKLCILKGLERSEILSICEGQEKKDFWEAIGGEKPYNQNKYVEENNVEFKNRLYQISNAKGFFAIDQIFDFRQTDLVEEDVMLLDTQDNIFIWIGEQSNEEERTNAFELAQKYLIEDPSERDTEIPITMVKQGNEPLNFIGHFTKWDKNLWKQLHGYQDIKNEIISQGKSPVLRLLSGNSSSNLPILGADFDTSAKYPINKLRVRDPMELPDGVDPSKKEIYLSNDEFNEVFGMDFQKYQKLPQWRQIELKKKAGLF